MFGNYGLSWFVFASLDEKQRKSVSNRDSKRIELGAIYDTTCKKCGGKGR